MKNYQNVEITIVNFTTEDVCATSITPDYSYDIFHLGEGNSNEKN